MELVIEYLRLSAVLNVQDKVHGVLDVVFIGADDLQDDTKDP